MSHSSVLVILPADELENPDYIMDVLRKHDENYLTGLHDVDCECLNVVADMEAARAATAQHGTFGDLKKEYLELCNLVNMGQKTWDDVPEWKAFIKPWLDTYNAAFTQHPLYNKPNPNCSFCFGTGKMQTYANKEAKYDYWQFPDSDDEQFWIDNLGDSKEVPDHSFGGKPFMRIEKTKGANFSNYEHSDTAETLGELEFTPWDAEDYDFVEPIGKNILPVSRIAADYETACLLLPDGVWLEAQTWNPDDDPEWKKLFHEALKKHEHDYVVIVDCHT